MKETAASNFNNQGDIADLSPYTAASVGLRFGWQSERWGFYAEGSVVQTFFDDFLYLDSLTAIVVQSGVRISL